MLTGSNLVLLLPVAALLLLYLIVERIRLQRLTDAIPLRISVTGTRGKSSVTRIIASILREEGRNVVAKTTGSQARFIDSDGGERDIRRGGIVSIIEQKSLIKEAAGLQADSMVAEIMSIHPENHLIESHRLLRPGIVVITNSRLDHVEAMGRTEDEVASVLSLDITRNATVFLPENESRAIFRAAVRREGGELVEVREGSFPAHTERCQSILRREFQENLDLAWAVAEHLDIDSESILNGISKAAGDIGAFRIWRHLNPGTGRTIQFVNGFAANDPESTLLLIEKVKKVLPSAVENLIGLLLLRPDRGERTVQWIEALRGDRFDCFNRLYVTGGHSRVAGRKLAGIHRLKGTTAEGITRPIMAEAEDRAVVLGFGNIVGRGELLVDYWSRLGVEDGI